MKAGAVLTVEIGQCLLLIYKLLETRMGNLHWWPGDSPFEVIVGAILTQNTAWRNVEMAIDRIRAHGLLYPEKLLNLEEEALALLIRPAGYYNVKAHRLKSFLRFLFEHYRGNLEDMFAEDPWLLRNRLLQINGIGEETADSILLYAGNKPFFVIDAYTRRILQNHAVIGEDAPYGEVQGLFMSNLPPDPALYNQYHALMVNTGKLFCTKKPKCEPCPLYTLDAHSAEAF